MQPHQERVITEKQELDDKLQKLSLFLTTPVFQSLDTEEQQRLRNQFDIMAQYSNILNQRIQAFN